MKITALDEEESRRQAEEADGILEKTSWRSIQISEEMTQDGVPPTTQAAAQMVPLSPVCDARVIPALPDTHQDPEILAAQRRGAFANLLERAANLQKGGSLTMLALLETEALAAVSHAVAATKIAEPAELKTFSLEDFKGRRDSELERLRKLQDRGIGLTKQSLTALGIAAPGTSRVDGKAARELQSLSDGQVVLDLTKATADIFPAVEPGATFSRFGLGSASGAQASTARDVRPPALQAVAAHLRTLLALESEGDFILAALLSCAFALGAAAGGVLTCACGRGRQASAGTKEPGHQSPWARLAIRAIRFVRRRRAVALAFQNFGSYSLRPAEGSRPTTLRQRRASTPVGPRPQPKPKSRLGTGPGILHEGPAIQHGSNGRGA
eukprot:s2656_g3.t1